MTLGAKEVWPNRHLLVSGRLRVRRDELGLTQKQVVARLARIGVHTSNRALSSIEHGAGVDVARLPELAEALDCTVTYLLGLTSDPGRWTPEPAAAGLDAAQRPRYLSAADLTATDPPANRPTARRPVPAGSAIDAPTAGEEPDRPRHGGATATHSWILGLDVPDRFPRSRGTAGPDSGVPAPDAAQRKDSSHAASVWPASDRPAGRSPAGGGVGDGGLR